MTTTKPSRTSSPVTVAVARSDCAASESVTRLRPSLSRLSVNVTLQVWPAASREARHPHPLGD